MIAGELQRSKPLHFTEEPGNPELKLPEKQEQSTAETHRGRFRGRFINFRNRVRRIISLASITGNSHQVQRHLPSLPGATATLQRSISTHFSEDPGNPAVQLPEKQEASSEKTTAGKSVKLCQGESIFTTFEPVTHNTHFVDQHFLTLSGATATNATDNIRTTAITSKANSYLKTAMQMTTAKLAGIHAGDIDPNSNRVVVDIDTCVIPDEVTLFDFLDDYRQDAANMAETDKKIRVSMANVMEREVACRNWELAHVSDAVRCMYPAYRLRNSENTGLVKPPAWFCEYHDVDKWDLNEIFKLLSLLSRAKAQIVGSGKVDKKDKDDEVDKLNELYELYKLNKLNELYEFYKLNKLNEQYKLYKLDEVDKVDAVVKSKLKMIQDLNNLIIVMISYIKMKYAKSIMLNSEFRKKVEESWRKLFPDKFNEHKVKIRNGLKNFLLEIDSFDKFHLWKLKSYDLLVKMASLLKDQDMKKVLTGRLLSKSADISPTGISVSSNGDYVGVHSKSDNIHKVEGSIISSFLLYHRQAALVTICGDLSSYSKTVLFDVHDEPMQVYRMMFNKPVSDEEYLKCKLDYLKRHEELRVNEFINKLRIMNKSESEIEKVKNILLDGVDSKYDNFFKSVDKISAQTKFGFIFTAEDIRKTPASKFMNFNLGAPGHKIDPAGAIVYGSSTLPFKYIHNCAEPMGYQLFCANTTEANVKEITHLINKFYLNLPSPPDSDGAWKYSGSKEVFKDFIEGRQKCLEKSNIPTEKKEDPETLEKECSDLITLIHLYFKSLFVSVMPRPELKFERHTISAAQDYISHVSSSEKIRKTMEAEDIPLHRCPPAKLYPLSEILKKAGENIHTGQPNPPSQSGGAVP